MKSENREAELLYLQHHHHHLGHEDIMSNPPLTNDLNRAYEEIYDSTENGYLKKKMANHYLLQECENDF